MRHVFTHRRSSNISLLRHTSAHVQRFSALSLPQSRHAFFFPVLHLGSPQRQRRHQGPRLGRRADGAIFEKDRSRGFASEVGQGSQRVSCVSFSRGRCGLSKTIYRLSTSGESENDEKGEKPRRLNCAQIDELAPLASKRFSRSTRNFNLDLRLHSLSGSLSHTRRRPPLLLSLPLNRKNKNKTKTQQLQSGTARHHQEAVLPRGLRLLRRPLGRRRHPDREGARDAERAEDVPRAVPGPEEEGRGHGQGLLEGLGGRQGQLRRQGEV